MALSTHQDSTNSNTPKPPLAGLCQYQSTYSYLPARLSACLPAYLLVSLAAASTVLQVTSAAGPAASFKQASMQMNVAALAKCPTSTCAAADNETLLAASNATSSLNETAVTEDNVTTASNLTGPANATAGAAGAKGSDAAKSPAGAPAPAAKSAAVGSSPVRTLVAAAAVAAIAAML